MIGRIAGRAAMRSKRSTTNYGRGSGPNSRGGSADQQGAALVRDQWKHWKGTYKPLENEVLPQLGDKTGYEAQGDAAGAVSANAAKVASSSLGRAMSRAGVSLTAEERAVRDRRNSLTTAKGVAGNETSTRRHLESRDRSNMLEAIRIGRGVVQGASAGLTGAAGREAARQQAEEASSAAASAQRQQAFGTVAMLAIMIAK